MKNNLIFQIGLTLIPGIGPITAKKLISHCGSVEAVFQEKKELLTKIPHIGPVLAKEIAQQSVLGRAEKEIDFMSKNNITATSYLDDNYPERLKNCVDSPIVLFSKGEFDWNQSKIISIVGTRNATSYGKSFCQSLVNDLSDYPVLIVSGLAYGIDVFAHKYSIENNVKTVAVLAHGIDRIYPTSHKNIATQMLQNGGLITEFLSETNLGRENFVRRNRIVAGISDATIVVESKKKGGAMITAKLANDYNRDVFAVPGKWNDVISSGCNHLIKTNQAHLCNSAQDIAYLLDWDKNQKNKTVRKEMLNQLEKEVVVLFENTRELNIDQIKDSFNLSFGQLAVVLTDLELKNVLHSSPGKIFSLK
ncbi:MAG: DNA-processing protein DprA [Flavobacteriales bacterium]